MGKRKKLQKAFDEASAVGAQLQTRIGALEDVDPWLARQRSEDDYKAEQDEISWRLECLRLAVRKAESCNDFDSIEDNAARYANFVLNGRFDTTEGPDASRAWMHRAKESVPDPEDGDEL